MKRLLALFFSVCCVMTATWANDFAGKVVTQSKASEIKADTWYSLYNATAKKFLCENGKGALVTGTTPALCFASEMQGSLVKFVANGSDWYLQTANGTYVGELAGSTLSTTATATASYTVEATDAGFTLKNGDNYLSATATSIIGSASASAWTLYEVSLKTQDNLTASQKTSFVNKYIKRDEGALIRMNGKRTSASYLTGTEDSKVVGAANRGATDMSQIWLVRANGEGYTFLNANTGSFLGTSFGEQSGNSTTLYIQESPNNSKSEAFYNISSKADFSGKSCMNLGEDGKTMYEWSYAGDAGCDWNLYVVSEVSLEDVYANIAEKDPYAKTLEEGKYYRIYNVNNNVYITDAGTFINCKELGEDLIQQYWTVKKKGNGYMFQNALTQKYIQPEPSFYTTYSMGTNEAALYLSRTSNTLKTTWYITNTQGATTGMHCDGSKNVVCWYNENENNIWAFEEAELSQEDLDAARAEQERVKDIMNNIDNIKTALQTIYSDQYCTTLNASYAAMTDEQLQADAAYQTLPKEMQEMTLKIKNDTWRKYDKFYRINEAEPMSNTQYWANRLRTTQYSPMNNPTGVTANCGDIIFVWVGKIPDGINMELRTHTDYTSYFGNETMPLKEGLNVFSTFNNMSQIYIDYTVENGQLLENFPFVPYHIEGGTVNGFMDTRKQTNADWLAMWKEGYFKDEIIDIISERTQWRALTSSLRNMKMPVEAMASWDKSLRIQHELMGITAVPEGVEDPNGVFENLWGTRFNNRMLSICWNGGGNPNSGAYRVYMSGTGNAMSDGVVTNPDVWVIGHEVGHHNQGAFNMAGCTEVSNNVFSNAVAYNFNLSARTESMSTRQELAAEGRDNLSWATSTVYKIFHATDLYFKLYMYYHVLGHDPLFYPKMFKSLRNNPLERGTTTAENEYLKFALVACEAANEDLTEFFDYWGFFHNYGETTVTDYSSTTIKIDEGQIKRVKAKMAKYPKASSALIFLDDFEDYNTGKKGAVDGPRADWKKGYKFGDYHHFMDEGPTLTHDNYASYSKSGAVNITTKIAGVAGIKVYNANDELMYFANTHKFTIPAKIRNDVSRFTIVLYDGTEMPLYLTDQLKEGEVWALKIYTPEHPEGLTRYTNGNDNANMSEERDGVNAIGIISSSYADGNEMLLAQRNIVNKEGVAQNVVIDGNHPMVIPQDITVQNLAFSKDGEGFQALKLPFDVPNAVTVEGTEKVGKRLVKAGSPVVMEGKINFELPDVTLSAGTVKGSESGFVMAADGNSTVASEGAISPFTYVFDGAYTLTTATAINDILSAPNANEQKVYDMNGRRVTSVKQPGLYIMNGKKMMVR